jgi:cytochrome P450
MTAADVDQTLIVQAARYLGDPAFRRSPEQFYSQLLDGNQILGLPNGLWLIAGHAEIRAVLRDSRFSRAARADRECDYLNSDPRPAVQGMAQCQRGMMLGLDPPAHTRVRRFHRPPFMPRAAANWAQYIDDLADNLARALPRDAAFDLKQAFALPIPERTICRILGVPEEDHRLWERWGDQIVNMDRTGQAGEAGVAPARDAMSSFGAYFSELIDRRRETPAGDLISELANAQEDGDRLTDAELVGNLILLIIAGHETTANSIASAIVLLMRDRTQWDQLVADESLIDAAVEETLRLEGAQRFMAPRVALEDVQIGEHRIVEGDEVICVVHAANRDPRVFDDPLRFDVTRDTSAHLAFGNGSHLCLGIHLARMEMRAAIKALVRHHPSLELAADEDALETTPSPTVRGWAALPCVSPTT